MILAGKFALATRGVVAVMTSHTHRIATLLAALTVVAIAIDARASDADIGTATSITTTVTGSLGGDPVTLKTGDAVQQNEVITTDASGVAQFQFRDETKLAVGPGSSLTIDNFIYDSETSATKVVVNLGAGALRFITGKGDHKGYEIVTPTATIGVRGTAFDVYARPDGELAVAMLDGEIEVCPKGGVCRLHNVVGEFLHMTPLGLFSLKKTWDGSFMQGVPIKIALPFIGDQKNLVPALRKSTSVVSRYARTVGKETGKVLKLPLTKIPKLKLPNPFR
jgi:hypothetical protein